MNHALKFLLIAFACIIVIGLITLGVRITDKGKKDTDSGLKKYDEAVSNTEDTELKVFDEVKVSGSEIKQLIKEYDGHDYLSIVVDTEKGVSTSYINECIDIGKTVSMNSAIKYSGLTAVDKTNQNYINDNGKFKAKVYCDKNEVIACLWFEQQ